MELSKKRMTKALIRLRGCAGWSAPVLFENPQRQVFSRRGPIIKTCKNNVTVADSESLGRSLTRKMASVGRARSYSTSINSRIRVVSQQRSTQRRTKALNVSQQGSNGRNKQAQPDNQNNNKTADNKPSSGELQSNLTLSSQSS